MTREPAEWAGALQRQDDMAIWAIGAHPRLLKEDRPFAVDAFEEAVKGALVIGEVGLDRRALSSRSVGIFDEILAVARRHARPVSIHSVGASGEVIAALGRSPVDAPVLHWWRGSTSETQEAIRLGAFFSLNGAEVRNPKVLALLPRDRILTETDYPHSRRYDKAARRPAAVQTIEAALMELWKVDQSELRRQIWRNFGALFDRCSLLDELPASIQETILAAGL
ncbi:MAG: TatD family hydrolase [Gemmatimonadales bacterium]